MRLVQQANQSPFRCAVIPFKGNSNSRYGFIDTGQHLRDEKVYVSVEAAFEIGKLIGWSPPSHKRGLEAENAALKARIDQLEAELLEADKFKDSIDYIGREQMKPYKKPGRPKKEATA